jgi:hypothetical protein
MRRPWISSSLITLSSSVTIWSWIWTDVVRNSGMVSSVNRIGEPAVPQIGLIIWGV